MTKRALIWLVDDTALEAESARRTLEPTFEVRTFFDGSVALEELANGAPPPELLILDWHMPGLSGIEICQYLRSNQETQSVPILMLTSNDQTEDVVKALSSGADDFVRKPHQPAELMARTAALLRSHRLLLRAEQAERAVLALLTQLPDAVLALDATGRVAFANDEAERILASLALSPPTAEAPPRPESGTTSTTKLVGQDIRRVLPTLEPSLLSQAEGHPAANIRDIAIGAGIYAPVVGRVQLDETVMATVTLRDVTAKHREESRRLDFYSIIAHDLRSPLNAMNMRTHLLLDGARGPVSDEVRAELQKILDRVKGLAVILNDFLDLARLEATSILIEGNASDLRQIIDESIEILWPLAEAKKVTIQVSEGASMTPHLAVDRRRIGQVISNLLSNAIKFSPENGDVVIAVSQVALGTEVTFRDAGCGIPAADLALLFQRYARVPGSRVAGTGLGLMIVREVIEAHGGTVQVKSEVGRGSSFSFLLPRSLQRASLLAPEPAQQS